MRPLPSSAISRVGMAVFTVMLGLTCVQAETITTFDIPNSISTQPTAINPSGRIAGFYTDAVGQHGFLRQPDGTVASFDVPTGPLGGRTTVTSINAKGQIAGYVFSIDLFVDFGFLRETDGTLTVFPNVTECNPPDGMSTRSTEFYIAKVDLGYFEGIAPTGINDRGQITGGCGAFPPDHDGFLRQSDGTMIAFTVPVQGPPITLAQAINSPGQITGYYYDYPDNDSFRGFLREPDGTFTTFGAPYSFVDPTTIGPGGQIAGSADGHGFLRQPDGSIVIFDVPDSTSTQPTAMNPRGEITGNYLDTSQAYHGFLRLKCGTITTLDVPNATNTYPTGINARGDITGWFTDASGVHGFVIAQ